MRSSSLVIALFTALSLSPAAESQSLVEFAGTPLEGANIEAIQTLPVRGMKAVLANNRLVFMSDTGRFVFVGDVYDTWSFRKLATIEAVTDAVNRVNLANFNLDIRKELRPFVFGEGEKEVVVFVDPMCPHCHELLNDLNDPPKGYSFLVLPIPALGAESGKKVRELGCATDRAQAKAALLTGNYPALLPQAGACDLLPLQKALVTAQVVGVQGVPFVIAPDGRVKRGRPKSLLSFLEGAE